MSGLYFAIRDPSMSMTAFFSLIALIGTFVT
jgi:hypothetical protein